MDKMGGNIKSYITLWLAMLASNVDAVTSHETRKFKIFNLKTIANKLKYDYSLYTLRVNIRILTRRSLASSWSSVDEDLRAQENARLVSRRAHAWRARARARARARVMWTRLYRVGCPVIKSLEVRVLLQVPSHRLHYKKIQIYVPRNEHKVSGPR